MKNSSKRRQAGPSLMNASRFLFWLPMLMCLGNSVPALTQSGVTQRGVVDSASKPSAQQSPGPYYALVVGIDNYRYLPQLKTAVSDADAVAALLRSRYGFTTRVLHDATRGQIMGALSEYRRTLPDNSNLVIYYGGHGYYDKDEDRAYWLPVDAKKDNNAAWIIADEITSDARAVPSRHVLVISDSCYSGGLNRDVGMDMTLRDRGRYLQQILQAKSRDLMSSGGNEPVADSGGEPGHSVFAGALLTGLAQMNTDAFTASELFMKFIQPRVAGRSEQVPQYGVIRDSGHEDGDFVFFRLSVKATPIGGKDTGALLSKDKNTPGGDAGTLLSEGKSAYHDQKYQEAFGLLERAAQAGNSEATYYVGYMYDHGDGVTQDYQQARQWYQKAADAGDAKAIYYLGSMYDQGRGVTQDYQQARKWYQKAIDAGNAEAMDHLGSMYEHGHGVTQDYAQARQWFQRAADAGNADAMNNLGYLFEHGRGVTQDYQQARQWFQKAADAGSADAKQKLQSLPH